jgi:hypothetical protein
LAINYVYGVIIFIIVIFFLFGAFALLFVWAGKESDQTSEQILQESLEEKERENVENNPLPH